MLKILTVKNVIPSTVEYHSKCNKKEFTHPIFILVYISYSIVVICSGFLHRQSFKKYKCHNKRHWNVDQVKTTIMHLMHLSVVMHLMYLSHLFFYFLNFFFTSGNETETDVEDWDSQPVNSIPLLIL